MNALLLLAQVPVSSTWITALIALAVLFFFTWICATRYRRVGPNRALIVYGRGGKTAGAPGFRIRKGGGTIVIPILERAEELSLELMTIDVNTKKVYTSTGVAISVDGVAQVKIKGDDVSIATAGERFMSMPVAQVMEVARQTLEGHLRAIVGTLTVEQIYKDRDAFAGKVQEVAANDLANMGLSIDSFTMRDIQDDEGYLDALGRPRVAQVKRDAAIAEAEAKRDSDIKSAQANQLGREAEFVANTKIAEAQRDFEAKQASYQGAVNAKKAEADLAYELQKNKTAQLVMAEEVQVQVIQREKLIEVQEKEILRKQKELSATINAPADAERYRIETLAQASRCRLQAEAEGEGTAKKLLGQGEGEAIRARGQAEAEIIQLKGQAEAKAMDSKAQAWQEYNQAAVIQMVVNGLPELARAIAEPLGKTDKITIVSTGGDSSAGASKVTKDIAEIIAQLPPVIQSLSGVDLAELIRALPQLRSGAAGHSAPPPPSAPPSGRRSTGG
ncbi:MAG TPA: SPFH domain-containing protein [Phycisphaerae bacterium]|nr:SPFH domain-containing protein [Phycisphaerae bacterium]HNU43673.1 SPFH domain-containing protein [Phycisphaerae bacterium]